MRVNFALGRAVVSGAVIRAKGSNGNVSIADVCMYVATTNDVDSGAATGGRRLYGVGKERVIVSTSSFLRGSGYRGEIPHQQLLIQFQLF